mgnify:CR=1 FL=1
MAIEEGKKAPAFTLENEKGEKGERYFLRKLSKLLNTNKKKITEIEKGLSQNNCQTLLLKIMPSLIEKNFHNFCEGIQKIQENTAKVFFKSQGGKYTSEKIEKCFINTAY